MESFKVLEPTFDGFRNYMQASEELPAETLLVERAFMLNLTPPEMTVLIGGMRALNANVRAVQTRCLYQTAWDVVPMISS